MEGPAAGRFPMRNLDTGGSAWRGPRGRRPGGLCLSVRGKGSGGGMRGWGPRAGREVAAPGGQARAPWGAERGRGRHGRRAHLTRNCSFHTFPLLWHSSRSRRQVLETRPMSAAVSEPLHRMYSSTSPGRLTRQLRPAASGAASSASAGTTSIALSTAAAAILSAYLGPPHARARARAPRFAPPTRLEGWAPGSPHPRPWPHPLGPSCSRRAELWPRKGNAFWKITARWGLEAVNGQ